jgi:serine/threonine protein kinase
LDLDLDLDLNLDEELVSALVSFPSSAHVQVVTLWYRAPEILLGSKSYSFAVDVWAVACIIVEIATHAPPFKGANEAQQIERIFEYGSGASVISFILSSILFLYFGFDHALTRRILGTPSELTWPGVNSLPHYPKTRLPCTLFRRSVLGSYHEPALGDLVDVWLVRRFDEMFS